MTEAIKICQMAHLWHPENQTKTDHFAAIPLLSTI